MRHFLDTIDWNILKELQENGRISNIELSKRVGVSAPSCLRRVRILEEAGIIQGYQTLLNEVALGCEVTMFAFMNLISQADQALSAFEKYVQAHPLVRKCWMLSGEVDFVLKCIAPNIKSLQSFVSELTAAPGVKQVRTALSLRALKDLQAVPIELLQNVGTIPLTPLTQE